jgi:hypothetical protein
MSINEVKQHTNGSRFAPSFLERRSSLKAGTPRAFQESSVS